MTFFPVAGMRNSTRDEKLARIPILVIGERTLADGHHRNDY